MNSIYMLIPLSLVLIGAGVWAFFWAVNSGQFDDLDAPGRDILDESDTPAEEPASTSPASRTPGSTRGTNPP